MKKLLACLLALYSLSGICASGINAKWGAPLPIEATVGSDSTVLLDTATEYVAAVSTIMSSTPTVDITHLGFKVSSVAGDPGAVYTISLQSVGADGLPTGTILGSGAAVGTFDPTGKSGWEWVAFDAAYVYTASRGDIVAIVVTSVNDDVVNNLTVAYMNAARTGIVAALPYAVTFNGVATYTKSPRMPLFGWKNTDASIVGGFPNATVGTTSTYGATVERGMLFNIPATSCSTATIKGVRWSGATESTGTGTYQMSLYSLAGGAIGGTTTNIQSTAAIDNDVVSVSSGSHYIWELYFPGTLATIVCGQWYAIGLSTTTAANSNLQALTVETASDFNAYNYEQQTTAANRTITYATPITTTTAFTSTATSRPWMEIIFGEFNSGSIGGVF